MSAIDNFIKNDSDNKSFEQQKATAENTARFIEIAKEFNETLKNLYNIEISSTQDKANTNSSIQNLTFDVKSLLEENKKSNASILKVADPKALAKGNGKKGFLKASFFKLVTLGLKKLIKNVDKNTAAANALKNQTKTITSVTNQASGPAKAVNNTNVDANAAVKMGQNIGGILAKSLTPGKLVSSFLDVMLPKILMGILLLTIFIKGWFNTDLKTAFEDALAIVAGAFLAYIAWQVIKATLKIAFEYACTVLVTSAKLAEISFELMSSFLVYAAWLIIIPLVLICFVLLVGIIAIVVIAILNSITQIVEVIGNVITNTVSKFFDFLEKIVKMLFFGSSDSKEEKADTANTEDAVIKFIEFATNAVTEIHAIVSSIGDVAGSFIFSIIDNAILIAGTVVSTVVSTALSILTTLSEGLGLMMYAILGWLYNPMMMTMLAAAAGASFLANRSVNKENEESENDSNSFSKAIKPLIDEVKVISDILSTFAVAVSNVTKTTIKTVSSAKNDVINNSVTSNDTIGETKSVFATPSTGSESATFNDANIVELLKAQNELLTKILASSTNVKKGFFG